MRTGQFIIADDGEIYENHICYRIKDTKPQAYSKSTL